MMPQGHGWQKALDLVISVKKVFFFCFSHGKSMGSNDPRGGAIFDPRGMIRRIYVKVHITMLNTKYTVEALALVVS